MKTHDEVSDYFANLLDGRYDCVDRIVLHGYFALAQQGGGFRYWWRELTGSDATLDQQHLRELAGRFSRRVHAYAKRRRIPLRHCAPGVRKPELAEQYRPTAPTFTGVFLILVAKAPALVWEVTQSGGGVPHLSRKTPWPYVNHDPFHVLDKDGGHLPCTLSGHPPFGVQVARTGHEGVERRARQRHVPAVKEGNCCLGGSDFPALDRLAEALCAASAVDRLGKVCERWVATSCLCFALTRDEQAPARGSATSTRATSSNTAGPSSSRGAPCSTQCPRGSSIARGAPWTCPPSGPSSGRNTAPIGAAAATRGPRDWNGCWTRRSTTSRSSSSTSAT